MKCFKVRFWGNMNPKPYYAFKPAFSSRTKPQDLNHTKPQDINSGLTPPKAGDCILGAPKLYTLTVGLGFRV